MMVSGEQERQNLRRAARIADSRKCGCLSGYGCGNHKPDRCPRRVYRFGVAPHVDLSKEISGRRWANNEVRIYARCAVCDYPHAPHLIEDFLG